MNLSEVEKEVRKMDSALKGSEPEFKAAVLMLASLQEGPNISRLVQFTGYEREFVKTIATRLRQSGVWKRGQIHCEWFEKDGGIAFWLDVSVALGYLARA